MRKCVRCGGRLRRVHRTFFERFSYLAIFECKECSGEEFVPRRYRAHFGKGARCPKCGTFRITRLKTPDKIDPIQNGLLNLLERMAGGRIHHCRYCRIQFYDRRRLASESEVQAPAGETQTPAPEAATQSPDSARLDA